jgi:hypothetical protein
MLLALLGAAVWLTRRAGLLGDHSLRLENAFARVTAEFGKSKWIIAREYCGLT